MDSRGGGPDPRPALPQPCTSISPAAPLRVAVRDDNPALPTAADRGELTGEGGRGLRIADALATRWGIDPLDSGKSVWFEITTVPSSPASDGMPLGLPRPPGLDRRGPHPATGCSQHAGTITTFYPSAHAAILKHLHV